MSHHEGCVASSSFVSQFELHVSSEHAVMYSSFKVDMLFFKNYIGSNSANLIPYLQF